MVERRRSDRSCGFTARAVKQLRLTGLVIALLVSATACASSARKPPDFATTYRAALARYQTQFGSLQSQAQAFLGKDVNTQLTLFDRMSDVTQATVQQLHGLIPPPSIKPTFEKLVVTMTAQETSLTEIVRSAHKGDQLALNNALRGYADALQDGISLQQQVAQAVGSTAPTPSRS
jgi:hypothetical protein